MSDRDLKTPYKPPAFVEVSTGNGVRRRFAAGTKAGFAIQRINRGVEEAEKFSFIESVKDGEDAVEFGPDAELVSYGKGWQLRAVQEPDVKLPKAVQFGVSKAEARDEVKAVNQPVLKKFHPADFYPGGKLPTGKPPEDNMTYCRNLSLVVGAIFALAGIWVYLLENQLFLGP